MTENESGCMLPSCKTRSEFDRPRRVDQRVPVPIAAPANAVEVINDRLLISITPYNLRCLVNCFQSIRIFGIHRQTYGGYGIASSLLGRNFALNVTDKIEFS